MPRKVSNGDLEKVLQLYQEGKTIPQIAEGLKISHSSAMNLTVIIRECLGYCFDEEECLGEESCFENLIAYRDYVARQKGFENDAKYQKHLLRQKGFGDLASYVKHVVVQAGCQNLASYLELKQKGYI
jgi:hypothetical protein